MTRRLFVVLSLVLLLLVGLSGFVSSKASAHTNRPLLNCSTGNGCTGSQVWNGTVTGGLTTVKVPSYTGSLTNRLERFISFPSATDNSILVIGYCSGSASSGLDRFACVNNSGNFFYYVALNGSLVGSEDNQFAYHTGDAGSTVEIGASKASATSENVWIHLTGSGTDPCAPCTISDSNIESFGSIILNNSVFDTFTGTLQGTFHWTGNQYANSTGFHDQTNDGSGGGGGLSSIVGAQMGGWASSPNGETNEGGDLKACNKDTGTTCT